ERVRHSRIRKHQDGSAKASVIPSRAARSPIRTVAPFPASLETEIDPPQPSTSCRLIARPRPLPLVLVEKWGSKMRGRISAEIPEPSSQTEIVTVCESPGVLCDTLTMTRL